jgi:hypothetical protein
MENNSVVGGGVYPTANIKQLDRFKKGFNNPVAMADKYGFISAIQLPPLKVSQEPGRHLLQHLPQLHYQDPDLPGELCVVPQVLPHLQ